MRFSKHIYTIIFVLVSFICFGQNMKGVSESLEIGIKKGDAELVSSFFNDYIDLSINNREGLYSKKQAKYILKRFFRLNPPKSLIIEHIGGKMPTTYIISKLETINTVFKLVLLIKNKKGKTIIYQLRIEHE